MSYKSPFAKQRGVFTVFAALGIVVLIGFAGLAIDAGRMLVVRSELQTAMDSCALSGVLELNRQPDAAYRASSVGRFVGGDQNFSNFQSNIVDISPTNVTFPSSLNDPSPPSADTANGSTASFVRCEVTSEGFVPLLLSVLSIDAININVSATATLQSAQSVCAIPMAIMGDGSGGLDYGFTIGERIVLGDSQIQGFFQWANVADDPDLSGLGDYAEAFIKHGSCDANTQVDRCIPIQNGEVTSLNEYWNTRFGVYKSIDPIDAIPDLTGYGFANQSPPVLQDYLTVYAPQRVSAQAGEIPPSYSIPANVYEDFGTSGRRLATLPVVDAGESSCGGDNGSRRLIGWACALMVSPIDSNEDAEVEYIGPANAADTPCRTAGTPGPYGGVGPLTPVLIK